MNTEKSDNGDLPTSVESQVPPVLAYMSSGTPEPGHNDLMDNLDPVKYTQEIIRQYRRFPLFGFGGAIYHPDLNEPYAQNVRRCLDEANIPFELEFRSDDDHGAKVQWQLGAVRTFDVATKTFSVRPLVLSANKV